MAEQQLVAFPCGFYDVTGGSYLKNIEPLRHNALLTQKAGLAVFSPCPERWSGQTPMVDRQIHSEADGNNPVAHEIELIRRIAEKDRQAFETLYEKYAQRIFRYAVRMITDIGKAEEVTNDVMLEVWKGAGTFAGRSTPSTWIIGITRHLCLNAVRGKKMQTIDITETPGLVDDSPQPESVRETEDSACVLRRMVARLSPDHREVVELTFFQGCSYQEISEIVGCPENTVKTRMFHARKQLKTLLTRAGATPLSPGVM